MKTKKEYGRPEMRVVELRQKCSILVVSGQEQQEHRQQYQSEEW